MTDSERGLNACPKQKTTGRMGGGEGSHPQQAPLSLRVGRVRVSAEGRKCECEGTAKREGTWLQAACLSHLPRTAFGRATSAGMVARILARPLCKRLGNQSSAPAAPGIANVQVPLPHPTRRVRDPLLWALRPLRRRCVPFSGPRTPSKLRYERRSCVASALALQLLQRLCRACVDDLRDTHPSSL